MSVVNVEGGSDDSQINTDPKENGPINSEQTNHSPGIGIGLAHSHEWFSH